MTLLAVEEQYDLGIWHEQEFTFGDSIAVSRDLIPCSGVHHGKT